MKLFHPDITFSKGTIEGLYDYMENNPDVGNVMPKVIFPDGSFQYLCKLLPSPVDWFARMFIPIKAVKDKRLIIVSRCALPTFRSQ